MNISIKNCNCIDEAQLTIADNKLNIKFGPNGTGKSTISKAISSSIKEPQKLPELLPFKLREVNPHDYNPEITGIEDIKSVRVFNEEYLSNFTFKDDELVENSFEIFIKTPEYEKKIQNVNRIISKIKDVFNQNKNLEVLLSDLQELTRSFKTTSSSISKSSNFMKSCGSGNKLEHIPTGLEPYTAFLRAPQNVAWIGWQQQGHSFLEIADDCPFCATPAAATERKEQIKQVADEYDKKTIQSLNSISDIIEKLGKYFSEETRERLTSITRLKDSPDSTETNFLFRVITQIDELIINLEKLKSLSGTHFSENEKVAEKLPKYKIDFAHINALDSPSTREVVDELNSSLNLVLTEAELLQIEISKQRSETRKLIRSNKTSIDSFLQKAGYQYEVQISEEPNNHKLKLKHIDFDQELKGGKQHLSFGERNAFALVLFMYECLSNETDLIILDDPISSFDKDKKFAIMDSLFRGTECLRGKTVLMLTHDVEPIIDTVKVHHQKFQAISTAHFLKSTNGILSEQRITRNDVLTFAQICNRVIASNKDELIKLIYLRRLLEIIDDKEDSYEVISNLFKKRSIQDMEDHRLDKDPITNKYPTLSESTFSAGVSSIRKHLPRFDYNSNLERLSDTQLLKEKYAACTNGYERLQIYRQISDDHENTVLQKYIRKSYHIENDFICQLNPIDFDLIPQFVIDECDKAITAIN